MNKKSRTAKRSAANPDVGLYVLKYLRRCDTKAALEEAVGELAALVAKGRLKVVATAFGRRAA